MLLVRLDDPKASAFHLGTAEERDGQRCMFTDGDGVALGEATLRMVARDTVELHEVVALAEADRYRVLTPDVIEARAVSRSEVVRRREQSTFRQRVGEAWGWRCAITGEAVREVLEAAHLPGTSWRGGDNRAEDGILLRLDLHRLLDAGLLRIEQGVVRVSVGGYAVLDGRRVERAG